jgi:hypothetical protein
MDRLQVASEGEDAVKREHIQGVVHAVCPLYGCAECGIVMQVLRQS